MMPHLVPLRSTAARPHSEILRYTTATASSAVVKFRSSSLTPEESQKETTLDQFFILIVERMECSKILNTILLLSATELAEKIRNKQISCKEVVEAYIERIKEVNPIVNAVVEDRFDVAIEEARMYDKMLSEQKYTNNDLKLKYPLLGIPITVKESIGVNGMSHTAAQISLNSSKSDRDAEVIKLIKNAGGIILLVSNTPELCTNLETYNKVTGLTCNPYDNRKTSGGSSGGEAALVASGASLIGIGSDLLGSVRVPASFCGVWGHKPTAGIISNDHHMPTCFDERINTILTIGPLTRYQEDLPLILNVMMNKNSHFSTKLNVPLHEITIYYSEIHLNSSKVENEIKRELMRVLEHLQNNCKCVVKKVTFKTDHPILVYKYLGCLQNFPGLFENYPKQYFIELLYFLIGKSDLSLNHILLALGKKLLLSLPGEAYEECIKQIEEFKMEISEALGNKGVYLLPTHPTSATVHGHSLKKTLDYQFTSNFNLLGFPATQCPVGMNSNGLPIGLQVTSVNNNDALCLTIAKEINKIHEEAMINTLLVSPFLLLIKVFGSVFHLISIRYYFTKPQKCPPITNNILLNSATALVKMIANKEVACEQVIKAYISRINEVNPIINAVVQDRFEVALYEAREIDNMIKSSQLTPEELISHYPLLGIPLTIKESIAVSGCSNAAGKVFPKGKIATADAPIVASVKNAGAIPILVSNTPELSASFETTNNVTGRTVNPYDTRRTVGGSSGGEGGLLGAGASLIGLGSDIFGSLRLPASYCGVWGHKPSPRSVSVEGHYPISKHLEEWKDLFTLGLMTRYAQDLSPVLNVILEKEYRSQLNLNNKIDLTNVKFYYMIDKYSIFTTTLNNDVEIFIKRLVQYLKDMYTNSVQEFRSDIFKHAPESSIIALLSCDDVEGVFVNKGKGWYNKSIKYITGKSSSTIIIVLLHFLKRLVSILPNFTVKKYKTNIANIKKEIVKILGTDGVLIVPCCPSAAHYHHQMFSQLLDYSVMGIFNCLGFPVTSCPLGLNKEGLPIGVQIVAAPNNDRLTLAVAEEIEKVFGGWVPPS
ncbi:hypothetical protein FQR65_LT08542 [Abscondita terminalis]|nr:hypothetical protein FQR65_LT08542 [Abscondita terminalis]